MLAQMCSDNLQNMMTSFSQNLPTTRRKAPEDTNLDCHYETVFGTICYKAGIELQTQL